MVQGVCGWNRKIASCMSLQLRDISETCSEITWNKQCDLRGPRCKWLKKTQQCIDTSTCAPHSKHSCRQESTCVWHEGACKDPVGLRCSDADGKHWCKKLNDVGIGADCVWHRNKGTFFPATPAECVDKSTLSCHDFAKRSACLRWGGKVYGLNCER